MTQLPGGPPPAWRPTAALVRALVLAMGTIGVSLSLGRPDVAAMGAPVVFALIMALTARSPDRTVLPGATARVRGEAVAGRIAEVQITVTGVNDCQLVTVVVPDPDRGATGGTGTVPGGAGVGLRVPIRVPDWGTSALARPDVMACGPDGLWEVGPVPAPELLTVIAPEKLSLEALALPPILGGWAGDHTSRRPGQGGDLIDLREFAPGDRLKAIHWRAYARHQKLYVRRTESDADVEFVLCVDTRTEIRPAPRPPASGWARWRARTAVRFVRLGQLLRGMVAVPQPVEAAVQATPAAGRSSLDLTVAAAAAIAGAQLRAGDRVGLLDLSTYRRHIRMGNGTRHLDRILGQLGQLDLADWPWLVRAELWGVPPSAVVVIISPLTDEAVLTAATDCQARGHFVIVVDVLPLAGLLAVNTTPIDSYELDLLRSEREARLEALRRSGIPLVRWEAGNLADTLVRFRRAYRERR